MQPCLGFGTVGREQTSFCCPNKIDGYAHRDAISSHRLDNEAPVMEVNWHSHVASNL